MKCYLVYEFRQLWSDSEGKVDCLEERGFNDLHEARYDVVVLGIFDSIEKANEFREKLREETEKHPEVEEDCKNYHDGFRKRATVEFEMNKECKEFLMKEEFTEVY